MLGAAWIAGRAVMPAIAASDNGRLVALASRDAQRAHRMAAPYPKMTAFDSYDAVLDHPEVDAVYIPLVNSDHKEWTLRALAAGKHVLCEKPLAMNAREAEEMAASAHASGKHLMEAFMYRFNPRTAAFVESLREPVYVQATFGFTLKDSTNYRMQAPLGGGALLDVGCYVVNAARWILGEPVDVVARSRTDRDVDMTTGALLQFSDGQMADLWASFESPEVQDLTVVTRADVHRIEKPFTSTEGPDHYRLMVESFAGSVIDGRPVALPVSESIANLRVLDRIREAATRPTS